MKRSFLRIAYAITSLLAASVLWDLLSSEEVKTGKRPDLAGPRAVRNVRAAYMGWRAAFDPVAAERVVLTPKEGVVALEVEGLSKGERLEAWVINSLENIRAAIELQREVQSGDRDATEGLDRSLDELDDAIAVLEEIRLHADAVKSLRAAILSTQFARVSPDPVSRSFLLDAAISSEEQARSAMAR